MSDTPEIQLELKERLNYPEILQKGMLDQKAVLKESAFSMNKLNLMILDQLFDIPHSWYDLKFDKEIKDVITKKTVKNKVYHAGVQLDEEYMKENEIPLTIEVTNIHYFKLKLAIRNLLDRLNMLVRKEKIEMSSGKNLSIESLDDLIDQMDKQEKAEKEEENEET